MTETGFLLDDGCLCLGCDTNGFLMVSYTDPKAIRFARAEDADRLRNGLHRLGLGMLSSKPIEHAWG